MLISPSVTVAGVLMSVTGLSARLPLRQTVQVVAISGELVGDAGIYIQRACRRYFDKAVNNFSTSSVFGNGINRIA